MRPIRTVQWLLNLIFPPVCPVCKILLNGKGNDLPLCPTCRTSIKRILPPYCPRCGLPEPSGDGGGYLCGSCLKEKRHFEIHRSSGLYEGALKEAIHTYKYGGVFSLVKVFGDLLQPTFHTLSRDYPVDVMIPVPLHIRRLRERGFNQALLMVKELSKRIGIPYEGRVLQKIKDTPVQISLKKRERRKNLTGVFQVTDTEALKGKSVVLVDDVYTTGATVNECSRALLKAGAERVAVLTVARAL
ncbi:MAG: ComF family protein [Deltaproteobacteria bacterium]